MRSATSRENPIFALLQIIHKVSNINVVRQFGLNLDDLDN
jgi:hypothetical protein